MGHRVRVTGHGLRLLCFGTVGALVTLCVVAQPHAQARQAPTVSGDRFAGLEWTFVRVRYGSWAENLVRFRRTYWSDPWAIDGPAAEQNLSRRLQTVSAIQANDPIVRRQPGFQDDHLIVLAETPSPGVGRASREGVRQALAELRSLVTKDDAVFVILFGHGTFDGIDAKFNLVGPDLEASEWAELLDPLPGRVVFINTTSSSFPFLERLSARGRVIITATDSPAQRFDTVFPEFFVEALDEPSSDLDKNGQVSIWEAFSFASYRVRQWYEQRGRLSTERPMLDDTGDGVGKEAG